MAYTARNGSNSVVNDATGEIIGQEKTALWSVYQTWLLAGNVPASAPAIPAPAVTITYTQWLSLFTAAERAWAFSSNDPGVREMISRGANAQAISLSSPNVSAFLDLCISLGGPQPARKAAILANTPPA